MMHKSIPIPHSPFPIGTFRAGILTMTVLILLSTVLTWRAGESIRGAMASQINVVTAAQRLGHYGTVLEMAIKAVVGHGDAEAAAKYRAVQPELRSTLNTLRTKLHSSQDEITAEQVDRTDLQLITMEYEALELATAGKLDRARKIINSRRYDHLVGVYQQGVERIENRAASHVRATQGRLDLYLWGIIGLSAASLILVIVGWIAFVRPARRWGEQLELASAKTELASMQLHDNQQELEEANKKLFNQARVDPLTGLHTRLKFNEDVQSTWLATDPSPHLYCALMCDVDVFKQYNDTYGHLAGDRALQLVAGTLRSTSGPEDGVYRLGGEEFLIVSKTASAGAAAAFAERVCRAVESLQVPHSKSASAALTVSLGVALLDPGGEITVENWLRDADAALYEAKAAGRNQVRGPAFRPLQKQQKRAFRGGQHPVKT